MLVLSRKCQESVVIGRVGGFERLLKVTVLDVCGGKVRLGFEADADILIRRSELPQRIDDGGLSKTRPEEYAVRVDS
ncbi:MAG: carbon storage regulator [Planctomycetaceae bacterium]